MANIVGKFVPFLFVGIAIVAIAFGMILLFYLFAIGAIVGLILFVFSWFKEKFFPPKEPPYKPVQKRGRTIDSDDWKKL
jgi:hypothetical protein